MKGELDEIIEAISEGNDRNKRKECQIHLKDIRKNAQ